MTDIAIRVENLSKRFRIGSRQPYHRLSEVATNVGRSVLQMPSRLRRGASTGDGSESVSGNGSDEFWALKDVSFEVKQGEVVGIIGRNGAGKSTLLKILSRITEPTGGRFGVRGRVGSLLEVGTGFHPELTGRENIFLSGTILGMTRREVKRHLDEIIDFADIEGFLDTPVKRYSSGMKVRLGFAVAAHLQPEILIVDEVLAVGDAQFQKKCLGKMGDVAKSGRTVLFVSHNMAAVRSLCSKALLLERASVSVDSSVQQAVRRYLMTSDSESAVAEFPTDAGRRHQILAVSVHRQEDIRACCGTFDTTSPVVIKLRVKADRAVAGLTMDVHVQAMLGEPVLVIDTRDSALAGKQFSITEGTHEYIVTLPAPLLKPGRYSITTRLMLPPEKLDVCGNCVAFDVKNTSSVRPTRPGAILQCLPWERASHA